MRNVQQFIKNNVSTALRASLSATTLAAIGAGAEKAYIALYPFPTFEEREQARYQKRAAIYEQSSGSNLEGKIKDQNFGIVLVDMQDAFLKDINSDERIQLLREQKKVLKTAEEYDIPVLVFERDTYGKTTKEIQDILETVPRTKTFYVDRNNGFESYDDSKIFNPDYFPKDWLKQQGVDTLYMMGVNGNGSVKRTADSARDLLSFTVATSNDVIASAGKNSYLGSCAYESCPEAKAALSDFLEKGLLHRDNDPFLEYFRKE